MLAKKLNFSRRTNSKFLQGFVGNWSRQFRLDAIQCFEHRFDRLVTGAVPEELSQRVMSRFAECS